ncbi:MAG: DUF2802 domain-containing protein [Candidatus Accumulibacter phosphatis]|uniref:DUF2802 domain-containing protein n=1 Tax=Candidatus Accumulibacter phosphatis TaxID=327160 RepID=UPI001A428970|nr:DUF2802 domain-containing protein [Candidatus Accumulibacter phosphatis]
MDIDLLSSLGWREGLIAIIALLVLYILVMFLRMRRLQRDLRVAGVSPRVAQSAVAAYAAAQDPESIPAVTPVEPVAPVAVAAAVETTARVAADAPEFPWNEPPPEIPGQALIDALQREVYQLRCEVDELRGEVLAAREDFRRQLAQTEGAALEASSPVYNGAMQMAVQGHDATTIAHHCGIARAEADLVVALARSRNEGI